MSVTKHWRTDHGLHSYHYKQQLHKMSWACSGTHTVTKHYITQRKLLGVWSRWHKVIKYWSQDYGICHFCCKCKATIYQAQMNKQCSNKTDNASGLQSYFTSTRLLQVQGVTQDLLSYSIHVSSNGLTEHCYLFIPSHPIFGTPESSGELPIFPK